MNEEITEITETPQNNKRSIQNYEPIGCRSAPTLPASNLKGSVVEELMSLILKYRAKNQCQNCGS